MGATITQSPAHILAAAGVDVAQMPPQTRAALASLSEEEARILADVTRKFQQEGVYDLKDVEGNGNF